MKHRKNKNIKYSKSFEGFDYTGDITVKLMEDDRVYSVKQYHNNGTAKLFGFFADCLIGDYNVAKSSRPCRIVLFKAAEEEVDNDGNWLKPENFPNNLQWDDDTKVSTKVLYDSAVTPGTSDVGGSTVIYHFRLPYLSLADGSRVRKLALYPDMISSFKDDRCAYYLLDKEDEIVVPGPGGVNSNFTIIIDWKLHICNAAPKTTTTNSTNN